VLLSHVTRPYCFKNFFLLHIKFLIDVSDDHTDFGDHIPFLGSEGLFSPFWPLKEHIFFIYTKFSIAWWYIFFGPSDLTLGFGEMGHGEMWLGKLWLGKLWLGVKCFRGNGPRVNEPWGNKPWGNGPRGNENMGNRTMPVLKVLDAIHPINCGLF
jgi:hypothetical protein